MPQVRFTRNLQRFFPGLQEEQVDGSTVAEVIAALDARYNGLASYLVDERGALRKHVNIFVNDELVADRTTLQDPVGEKCQVHVIQALSGG